MANQDLRFRRRVTTVGAERPKINLPVILAVAASALIIVPALIYTAMHPAAVTSGVKQLTTHMVQPVKDIGRVAIVAARATPTPRPTPAPSPSATPRSAKQTAAQLARLERQKRARELALAGLHARNVASTGQTLDAGAAGSAAAGVSGNTPPATAANSAASAGSDTTPANAQASVALGEQQQPVADATPVYAPEVVVDARFVHQVQPDYPEVAKAQEAQGTAVVLATVGPRGNVISTKIDQSTGNKLLDQAALEAARQSTFEPPQINGKPATETYRLVYTFAL